MDSSTEEETERMVCIPVGIVKEALGMLRLLKLCPPNYNQVIVKGDEAIRLSGIDEWSVNEGKAYSSDPVSLTGLSGVIGYLGGRVNPPLQIENEMVDHVKFQEYQEAWVARMSKWLESVWPSYDPDEIRSRIDKGHPTHEGTPWSNKCHHLAMDLIHTRRSKSDIVDLVRWLLMGAASDLRINKDV